MQLIGLHKIHCLLKFFPQTPLYDVKIAIFVAVLERQGLTIMLLKWGWFFLRLGSKCANFQQKISSDISCGMPQTLAITKK